jgi:uncharacterized radical SAM superfamily Fe-S cluster-containing enzyme
MSLGFYFYGECKLNKDSLYIKYYITNKCNFSCDYCYRKEFSYRDEEPSYNDIDTMIEHLQGNNIDTFCFIGGEPSISDKIFYSIDKVFEHLYCKNVIIYSNAYNVSFFQKLKELYSDEHLLEFLASYQGEDPKKVVEGVMEDIHRHAIGAEQSDDITVMCLNYK